VTRRVRRHVAVEQDILDLAGWIARDSRQAAVRFFEAVEDAFISLRTAPGRGSPKRLRDKRLADIRSLAVPGFPSHLVLYDVRGADVRVFAVVHGARDYRKLLRDRTQ
jgi:plasmid stabilization system protein ParE